MRKMKTKLLVLLSVLVAVGALMAGPGAAAGTGTTTITGNPGATIGIVVHGNINNWALDIGTNTDSSNVTLDVTSNQPGWTVKVNDALDGGKPPASVGKMANWTTSAWGASGYLTTALNVGAASVGGHATGSAVDLTGSQQTIESGNSDATGAGTFNGIQITNIQQVLSSDPALASPNVYRIIVTFTGGLS